MCGICGYAGLHESESLLRRMTDIMEHRGPDDHGFFRDNDIGLGMRRLSIIDVSGGQQPIMNEDENMAVICNGEIYNYRELTEDLKEKGHIFSTKSDTETIIHLYEEYSTECVKYLRGIFAFAVYDMRRKRLFIARDRLGVKPLYYWHKNHKLVFASEIKSILECEDVPRDPCITSIDNFLSLRYVPGPDTLFAGINKLPPGHLMLWEQGNIKIERYWAPELYSGKYKSDTYYHERFEALLSESVKIRLMSEVPLGAYLSGGLDSSAIVSLMSKMSSRPVKTFSVGFGRHDDELPAARAIARKLGCDHSEIICSPEDFEILPQIIWNLDEPIGDAIIVPMYMLSKLAKEQVSVVLSGEGADEIMAGYFFHKVMLLVRRYNRLVPRPIREGIVRPLIGRIPAFILNKMFDYPGTLGRRGRRKLLDYLKLADSNKIADEYLFLISLFDERDKASLYSPDINAKLRGGTSDNSVSPDADALYIESMLMEQYNHWLPDDILMKQDKMSMANSIEARIPFLDHVLVEFLLKTPSHLKLSGITNKVLLRDYLKKLVPGSLCRQKKKAFYIPIEQYFKKGFLREMLETCLSESSVKRRGFFNWEAVKRFRGSIDENEFLFGKQVFALITMEIWFRIYIDREKGLF